VEGRFDEAVAAFELLQRELPDDPTVQRGLGIAYLRRARARRQSGRTAPALQDLRLGARLLPEEEAVFLFEEAKVRFLRREWETARILLRSVAEHGPLAEAEEILGCIAYLENRLVKATEHLRAAVAIEPAEPRLRSLLERFERECRIEAEFVVRPGTRFRFHLHPRGPGVEHEAKIRALLESEFPRICGELGGRPARVVEVVLYDVGAFTHATGSHPWVMGLYDGKIRVPIGPGGLDEGRTRDLLLHEFTHCVLNEVWPGAPSWLHEGLALGLEHQSGDPDEALRGYLRAGRPLVDPRGLPHSFARLASESEARFAYAVSHSYVAYLRQDHAPRALRDYIAQAGAGRDPAEAFRRAFGVDEAGAIAAWQDLLTAGRTAR
jgi:tetratricopeptide (TPR) repeat protein